MLGWLPPFRLLMGLRSPKRLLLFLGLMTVLEEEDISFLRPLVRSLERSRILFSVPLGFSGGRLQGHRINGSVTSNTGSISFCECIISGQVCLVFVGHK